MPRGVRKNGLKIAEVDGGVLFGRRHEDRAVAHRGQAEVALVVAVAVEEEAVEAAPGPRATACTSAGENGPFSRTQASSSSRVCCSWKHEVATGTRTPGRCAAASP